MSVKRAEMESPNEGFTTVFHSLQVVERLLFMTESVYCGLQGQMENTESGSGNGNGNGNSEKIVRSKSIYCRSRWKFDASVLVMGEKCYQSQA